ncbi:MAG: hypothetical protein ACPG19_03185 [Saprospiraceae bacterium]
MIKKIIFILVLGCTLQFQALACDVCGCSVNGTGLGLISAYRYNFVGMNWQFASFEGSLLHGSGSIDHFHTAELAVRYHFTDNFKILVNQPFKFNTRYLDEEVNQLNGLGDTRVLANYTFLKDKKIGIFDIYAELGAGAQLPLGQYDSDLHSKDLPENFNAGRGSWAGIVQPNIILTKGNMGLIFNGSYQYNLATETGYRFGNQMTGQLLYFYRKDVNERLNVTPYGGVVGERIAQDIYSNDVLVGGTSGKGVFGSVGVNVKMKDFLISAGYSIPLWQLYSLNEVNAKSRITAQVSYIF